VLLATWIFAPPQAGEKDERHFEKCNLCSRVPRLRFHVAVFWSHAKSRTVLGGTLGENAAWCIGHGSSTQADGCGLSPAAGPARHVVLCGHLSVFSSPPGRRMFASSHFSTNPPQRRIQILRVRQAPVLLHVAGRPKPVMGDAEVKDQTPAPCLISKIVVYLHIATPLACACRDSIL
jgi:hypothetical protein